MAGYNSALGSASGGRRNLGGSDVDPNQRTDWGRRGNAGVLEAQRPGLNIPDWQWDQLSPEQQAARNRQVPSPGNPNNPGDNPEHFANLPQWQELWDSIGNGADPRELLSKIGKGGFFEDQDDLRNFMEHPAWRQMMAFSTKNTPQWKQMAEMQYPTEQLISSGLGQIGASGRQAVDQGLASLQASGMSRAPGAAASIERSARIAGGQAGANLKAQVGDRAYQAELGRLGQMLQLEQNMQAIALGQSPDRSKPDNKATTGDWLALIGQLAGTAALICWVAREVYGERNPRWLVFRSWLVTRAPKWFFKLYVRYGVPVAALVRRFPILKRPIRAWMDRRIESLTREVSECAKTW